MSVAKIERSQVSSLRNGSGGIRVRVKKTELMCVNETSVATKLREDDLFVTCYSGTGRRLIDPSLLGICYFQRSYLVAYD